MMLENEYYMINNVVNALIDTEVTHVSQTYLHIYSILLHSTKINN